VILEDYGDSVLVNWGPANPNARVKLTPYSANGCPGAFVELAVVVNRKIEVAAAVGELEICFDPNVSHWYSAPFTVDGRGYEWEVSGGQIISGQGENEVEVIWDQPGITGTIQYSAYSLLDTECEGKAESIQIKVAAEIIAEVKELKEVRCAGEDSGSIQLAISGGTAPYKFEWLHDPALSSPEATNLSPGSYSVTITDQSGCTTSLDGMIVLGPEPLVVSTLTPVGVSCYGKSDGALSLAVAGGVAPYSVDYDGIRTFSGQISLSDMPSGQYTWLIQDGNGCSIPVNFEITSPIAMEVEVRLERPSCPGGTNGELIVLPAGGAGPFNYLWKDPTLSGNLATG